MATDEIPQPQTQTLTGEQHFARAQWYVDIVESGSGEAHAASTGVSIDGLLALAQAHATLAVAAPAYQRPPGAPRPWSGFNTPEQPQIDPVGPQATPPTAPYDAARPAAAGHPGV